jgi:trk system potassium uptake protein
MLPDDRSQSAGMRIIIVGGGEIGWALARDLSRDHGIFVIDHNPDVRERFKALDVEFLAGSASSTPVLRRAGVERADLLIACTGFDEVNVVACALANRLGSPRTICFVSREDFLDHAGSAESMREHFGIERVIWPEAQLAEEIERIIGAPGAIDAEAFAGGRIRLLEYRLEQRSPLVAGPISSLHLPHGALIVAVKQGNAITIPHGGTHLRAGDKIIAMGTPEAMRRLQTHVDGGSGASATKLVTVIGGGDVGFRLAQGLEARHNMDVRVIEHDQARGELLAASLRRTLVLHGDGTDLALLEAEEIGRSDVLVSVIDNDERNLFASLLGRQLGVRKIITRVSRPANLHLFERVGIDVALSARGAAVASVVHQIQGGRANLLAVLEAGQATIVEITVPAEYQPRALKDMDAPPQSIVGAILRGNDVLIPRGVDQVRPQDRLIVFATAAFVGRVRDYFGSAS